MINVNTNKRDDVLKMFRSMLWGIVWTLSFLLGLGVGMVWRWVE